jgi:sulfofructose kinase
MARDSFPIVDVCGVGLNATDTLIQLPHFPALDTKLEVAASRVCAGGQVASALQACAAWGLSARYSGKIGDDEAGELQRSELRHAGVEAHWVVSHGCESPRSWILIDQTGERTVLWKRDPKLELQPNEIQREWITHSRALLVDGHDTAAAALAARWAREAKIPVVADVDNLYSGVEALLQHVDYLIASREFPQRLIAESDLLAALPKIAARFGCKLVGATLGAAGVLAWDGNAFHYAPAYRVKVLDTTGAGDIFHAAVIYSLLQSWSLAKMLDFSCAAAALNCAALGARGGIRPVKEIEDLMANGTRHESLFAEPEFTLGDAAAKSPSTKTASRRSTRKSAPEQVELPLTGASARVPKVKLEPKSLLPQPRRERGHE